MNSAINLGFDLYALAQPKGRQDCIALAEEILSTLQDIGAHIDASIARCEAMELEVA